jgi:hypothetical protein
VNRRHWVACILFLLLLPGLLAAEVKRVVIVKLDGVPGDLLERRLEHINPSTGKSSLPWIDRVFAQQGARLANFYVRAISLSAPSWSLLDTGQHLEIRGNAEFDRYTYHVYDYLNFFPFYLGYALSHRVDMPGVEVLDELGIPLLIDRFPYQNTYQSFQLYQRGVRWKTLQQVLQHRFSRSPRELLDEWTMGLEIGSSVEEQVERDLIAKLADPHIRYLDYFSGEYDHVAHLTPDPASQRGALERIDALIGRIWTAIERSPEAARTVLVVVSDHGMNTAPGVYSQGYDLVSFLNSRAGGAHHVVTDRHPLTEYKLKGLDPFVSEVVTPSEESIYLKGASDRYPTALLDLDGNERAAVDLRNSDLNALHILLEELNRSGIQPAARRACIDALFQILDRHRAQWQATLGELREELDALHRKLEEQRTKVDAQAKKWTQTGRNLGHAEGGDKRPPSAEELNLKRAMGGANTIHDLQNYITGPTAGGFSTINYFSLLTGLKVLNNVQPRVGSHPVDFIAVRLPREVLIPCLSPEEAPDEDPVWLYGDESHQAIILSRHDQTANLNLRYLAVRELRQDSGGSLHFEPAEPGPGFPLRLWEDRDFAIPQGDRAEWLNAWHTDLDWFHAVHKTRYSNGIIALHEQFRRDPEPQGLPGDTGLLARFNARRRRLAEPDFLIFANDHWNFNVRGFNPGGNHGSLRRISMHSVLMLAGGDETGIPHHMVIDEPYDSLSLVPTILELVGLHQEAAQLPGRPIRELLPSPEKPVATP